MALLLFFVVNDPEVIHLPSLDCEMCKKMNKNTIEIPNIMGVKCSFLFLHRFNSVDEFQCSDDLSFLSNLGCPSHLY